MIGHNEPGLSTDSRPAFTDTTFPLAPDAVRNASFFYWNFAEHHDNLQNRQVVMRETNQLIADFCDNYLTSQTYDAAMMGNIVDNLGNGEYSEAAISALQVFYEQSTDSPEDKRYVLGLLSDRFVIQTFWQEQVSILETETPNYYALIHSAPNESLAPAHAWEQKSLGTKATEILRLRTEHGVNIESLLIASAETLQWLYSPAACGNVETLRKVHMAESLFAPFCEIIGFDGISMALQGRCSELRLMYTGHTDELTLASNVIKNMGPPMVVEDRVKQMLETVLGENSQEQVLSHVMPHGIVIGEGIALENAQRVVWRRKTIGSLARKLARIEDGSLPMDIIGATIITKDAAEIGDTMRRMIERIAADTRIQPVSAPSRDTYLHVKGTPDYIKTVGNAMGYASLADMEDEIDVVETTPEAYQVAKATFTFQRWGEPWPIHVEVQLNTEADRVDARIGSAAHALFKLGDGARIVQEDEIDAIAELHDQKKYLGENGLTSISRIRAFQLEQLLSYA